MHYSCSFMHQLPNLLHQALQRRKTDVFLLIQVLAETGMSKVVAFDQIDKVLCLSFYTVFQTPEKLHERKFVLSEPW